VAETDRVIDGLLQGSAEALDRLQRALGGDHERILGYFWNDKSQKLRFRLPEPVIWFFETDGYHETLTDLIRSRVNLLTLELDRKKYFVSKSDRDGNYFELTPQGVAYLMDKHPTLLVYWKLFLDLLSNWWGLMAGSVGFVAAVMDLIQVPWLRLLPWLPRW